VNGAWLFSRKTPSIRALKEKKDFRSLISALRHPDLEVQWEAAEALGALGEEGMDHLLWALNSRHKDIRLGVIEALGEIKDPRALSPLADQLDDSSNEIRWEAALALGEIGDPEAISHLVEALRDVDRYVRYGAALSLQKLGWRPASEIEAGYLYTGLQDWDRLIAIGDSAVPAIENTMNDPDRSIRLLAVHCMGEIGSQKAIPALYGALRDPDEEVRWEAALAGPRCGIQMRYLPRGLSRRPRIRKNPLVAAFLNFVLPGMGYLYLGMWWGVVVFQVDVYATLWLFVNQGALLTYDFLFPVYLIIALHAWYIARSMPDL